MYSNQVGLMLTECVLHDREASRKASLLIDSTVLDDSRTPLKLPGFERVVMLAATKALELWRDEALEGDLLLCVFTGNHH